MKSSETLILRKKLSIECYLIRATLLTPEKRPDIRAVLMLASENGGRISDKVLSGKFFPGLSIAIARNLIRRYQEIDLFDDLGNITTLGRETLKLKGEDALIPESGVYKVWATNDPIVTQKILSIEKVVDLDPYEFEENTKESNNKSRQGKRTTFERMPDWILQKFDGILNAWYDGKVSFFSVKEILDRGLKINRNDNRYGRFSPELELSVSSNRIVKLSIHDQTKKTKIILETQIDRDTVWKSFVKDSGLNWNGNPLEGGHALVGFNEITSQTVSSFVKEVPSVAVDLNVFGRLSSDPVFVEVQPVSLHDAEKWGRSLLLGRIDHFVSMTDYDTIRSSVRSRFMSYRPDRLPSILDLLNEIKEVGLERGEHDRKYWYLQMPMDLSYQGAEN